MKKITPHLWFDKEAKEAAEFYVAAFGSDSAVTALMPLDKYPFSERYGWLKDKFGVSWQITSAQMGELLGGFA